MSRKRLSVFVLIVAVAMTLTAFVAYRTGARRSREADFQAAGACIDFREAAKHTGDNACVKGRILKAYTSRSGNVFFDFCDDYRTCPFATLVFSQDRDKFRDLEALAGRVVEIRGRISVYHGKSEIVIHEPSQLKAD